MPRYRFDETSAWVERVSRAVGRHVPDLVSWEWSKGARKGRARLDYTQNALDQDAGRAVRRAPGAGRPGLGADRLGRARRSGRSVPTAGRSARSCSASPSAAICSRRPRPMPRSCPRSDPGWHHGAMPNEITLRTPTADGVPTLRRAAVDRLQRGVQRRRHRERSPDDRARSLLSARSTARTSSAAVAPIVPVDRARRRGRRRRRDGGRRAAEPPAARDPAPDDDLDVRPGARAARAGRDPVGVGGGDLPAVRLRAGTLSSAFEIAQRTRSVPTTGRRRRAGCGSSGSTRRAERFPPVYEAMRRSTPGSSDAQRSPLALGDPVRRRVVSATATVTRSWPCTRSTVRLAGTSSTGPGADWDSVRPEGRDHGPGADSPSTRSPSRPVAVGLRHRPVGTVRGSRGPVPHPLQLLVTEPRRLGARSTMGAGCGSSTCRPPWADGATGCPAAWCST